MKKIVFGGFCFIGGILLFCTPLIVGSYRGQPDFGQGISLFGAILGIFGLVLGVIGLLKDD
ncbi:MAG: hypothetical protein FWE60_03645 [Oscillospiraceae bacterium]|jgi:hypothetical protein|nr:hypothetical protein [Oscillospiraceae bacterium]